MVWFRVLTGVVMTGSENRSLWFGSKVKDRFLWCGLKWNTTPICNWIEWPYRWDGNSPKLARALEILFVVQTSTGTQSDSSFDINSGSQVQRVIQLRPNRFVRFFLLRSLSSALLNRYLFFGKRFTSIPVPKYFVLFGGFYGKSRFSRKYIHFKIIRILSLRFTSSYSISELGTPWKLCPSFRSNFQVKPMRKKSAQSSN